MIGIRLQGGPFDGRFNGTSLACFEDAPEVIFVSRGVGAVVHWHPEPQSSAAEVYRLDHKSEHGSAVYVFTDPDAALQRSIVETVTGSAA